MARLEGKVYSISEAAGLLDVKPHVLRQWEVRFDQLRPKRNRSGRRYYAESDIEILRRIKQLMRHEQMTSKGASRRITQEIFGEGRPQTRQEVVDLLDAMEQELRGLLELLGPD